ncbi:hypothetical protein [Lewinella cohaerens]|uniref:hypothetical protein n=1 Tax=Lewinella cohaerens TaxID=70995 RepID=UPI00036A9349|nr:hypothetical protein [Lewinella cohaerens]
MNRKKLNTNKKLPTALSAEALKQVKGGYREMPGTVRGSLTVRWDEITIRIRDDKGTKGLVSSGVSATRPSVTGSGMQEIMP